MTILEKLDGGIPVGPVQDMSDVYADPHVAARAMLETCHPGGENPEITLAANPIKYGVTPTTLFQSPPTLGQHRDEVLAEFGITPPDED